MNEIFKRKDNKRLKELSLTIYLCVLVHFASANTLGD